MPDTADCSKPLASFCLRCHNQKKFFKEALEAAFRQDYSPMEIVIYDDASTDGSDEMIQAMAAEYRASHGPHRIVYEHGSTPLGNIRSSEKVFSMANGELLFQADGDDISMPERVSRTIKAWIEDGKRAKLVYCSGWAFQEGGKEREVARFSYSKPRGAFAAYAKEVYTRFPPADFTNAFDDSVYGFRARLLGPELYVPDKLVRYRLGYGESNANTCKARVAGWRKSIAGREQALLDLNRYGAMLPAEERQKFKAAKLAEIKTISRNINYFGARSIRDRFNSRPYGLRQTLKWSLQCFKGHFGAILPLADLLFACLPAIAGEVLRNFLMRLEASK